jgi:hypothetical protein
MNSIALARQGMSNEHRKNKPSMGRRMMEQVYDDEVWISGD